MYAIVCQTKRVPMRAVYQHSFDSIESAQRALIELGQALVKDPKAESIPVLENFNLLLKLNMQGDQWSFAVVEEEVVGA